MVQKEKTNENYSKIHKELPASIVSIHALVIQKDNRKPNLVQNTCTEVISELLYYLIKGVTVYINFWVHKQNPGSDCKYTSDNNYLHCYEAF